jgi:hypothetical protein
MAKCSSLSSICIPSSVGVLRGSWFRHCRNLSTVALAPGSAVCQSARAAFSASLGRSCPLSGGILHAAVAEPDAPTAMDGD